MTPALHRHRGVVVVANACQAMSASFLSAVDSRAAEAASTSATAAKTTPGIKLKNESSMAAAMRGMRERATFAYRGISVEYSELPDAEDNLLFGNVLWPCAETLAKMLIDETKSGAKIWSEANAMQVGMPLEMLLKRRFGVDVATPPSPTALEWLGVESAIPDVTASGGASVLEVGAGVGLTGLVCHALGASSVLLTDGEERLVEALRARHTDCPGTLKFAHLDWHADESDSAERFDLIIGCEVLHPACSGEVHVPALIARKLAKVAGARAMLLSDVRSVQTCYTAVHALAMHGLRVAAFQIVGREGFQVRLDSLPAVGSQLLLVATWAPADA